MMSYTEGSKENFPPDFRFFVKFNEKMFLQIDLSFKEEIFSAYPQPSNFQPLARERGSSGTSFERAQNYFSNGTLF